jgi:transcriptional antiterminator NusG
VIKVNLASGDRILVLTGPFKDFEGEVIEVSPERSKLKALLSIFGRDTPVELEFNQVQKQE